MDLTVACWKSQLIADHSPTSSAPVELSLMAITTAPSRRILAILWLAGTHGQGMRAVSCSRQWLFPPRLQAQTCSSVGAWARIAVSQQPGGMWILSHYRSATLAAEERRR